MYTFKLPIGDRSDDGHGKCDYFIVESNVSFDAIVEYYKKMNAHWKVSLQCSDYGEDSLTEDFKKFLENLGFNLEDYNIDDFESKDLAKLIIDLLMKYHDNLELKILDIPMLYEDLPGYGLWD